METATQALQPRVFIAIPDHLCARHLRGTGWEYIGGLGDLISDVMVCDNDYGVANWSHVDEHKRWAAHGAMHRDDGQVGMGFGRPLLRLWLINSLVCANSILPMDCKARQTFSVAEITEAAWKLAPRWMSLSARVYYGVVGGGIQLDG